MKKPVLTTSLCAFTMLLTACGGSGSVVSNNAPSVTPIPSNPSTNNSNSSANNSTNTNTNTGATNPIEGAFITLDNNTR